MTDTQIAGGGLTEGTNLRAAIVPVVTDNQTAIGGLTGGQSAAAAVVTTMAERHRWSDQDQCVAWPRRSGQQQPPLLKQLPIILPTASSSTCGSRSQ